MHNQLKISKKFEELTDEQKQKAINENAIEIALEILSGAFEELNNKFENYKIYITEKTGRLEKRIKELESR